MSQIAQICAHIFKIESEMKGNDLKFKANYIFEKYFSDLNREY
jgi:hypothetical protein